MSWPAVRMALYLIRNHYKHEPMHTISSPFAEPHSSTYQRQAHVFLRSLFNQPGKLHYHRVLSIVAVKKLGSIRVYAKNVPNSI